MTSEPSPLPNNALDWEGLLADCIERLEQGLPIDTSSLPLAPHLIAELQDFLATHQRVADCFQAAPLANPSAVAPQDAPIHPLSTLASNANPLDSEFSLEHGPHLFGGYELVREIDRGGMGVVFLARHTTLQRTVALKMIKTGHLASSQEIRRFYAEARHAAMLDHPGIVPVFDVGESHGIHYYAMAYIEGGTLAESITARRISIANAASILLQLADAIQYAHERGIVHRDLKPANVLLDSSGTPRLMDFGLAKQVERDEQLSQSGQILGTPSYMAPEQAWGKVTQINSVDVYGLGAILYAMLTGVAPHQASTPLEVLLRLLEADPMPPRKINRQVPFDLEQICLKCLEREPERRYQSAAELSQDLQRYLRSEPVKAGHHTWIRRFQMWARAQPALAAHLAGLLPTLAIVQVTHWLFGSELDYYLAHTSALFVWIILCVGLQQWIAKSPGHHACRYLWACVDVAMMTLIIALAHGPRGNLLVGYAVLIVASGMFLREHFVLATTALTLGGYGILLGLSLHGELDDELLRQPHYNLMHLAALVVLGGLVAAQVRRIRALSSRFSPTPWQTH